MSQAPGLDRARVDELVRGNAELEKQASLVQQREQAEQDRFEMESRLQSILDHAPSVIYLKGLDGKYLLVNQQFLTIFNRTLDQVIGKDDFALFSKESAEAFQKNDQ